MVEKEKEKEKAQDEEEDEEEEEEEVEEEVFEHEINGKSYYVTSTENGIIYSIEDDEDIGPEVGTFKDSIAVFD